MELVDVHVHLFPEDVVDDYIANYAAHSGLRPVCRPTVERLFGEYDGIDVRAFVVLPARSASSACRSRADAT